MRELIIFLFTITIPVCIVSCGKDNYEMPTSKLSGKITYQGEPLGLQGTAEAVQLQLYQDGYEKTDPIPVYAKQDGTFDALLFDGEYKLITRNNNGPWLNSADTLRIQVKGNTPCEILVTPYFTISDVDMIYQGQTVKASCTVNRIVKDAKIQKAMLFINKTIFVDEISYITVQNRNNPEPGKIEFSFDMAGNKNLSSAHALFARIGVKAAGADQAIYSEVIRLR